MDAHENILAPIRDQRDRLRDAVIEWAQINSGTFNLEGLGRLSSRLTDAFAGLGGRLAWHDLPPLETVDERGHIVSRPLGRAMSIVKRPEAPLRVFLGIHMDTVYDADSPFRQVEQIDPDTLRGPGVADAKGGLAVMLAALEAIERSPKADAIGWEVLINPDEEIGSPGSADLLARCAARNHLGLVFEPAFADGAMVQERKGSGNYSLVIRGKAAHAGRDFRAGRNAIHAAADFVVAADRLNGPGSDLTLNVGRIDGGGPVNVVPDLAVVRFNVRVVRPEDQPLVESELSRMAADVARRHDVATQLHGRFLSPPKVLDEPTRQLRDRIGECGESLGLVMRWQSSGGVSDGNKLAAAGLPVIDTMGPRGGNLHSPQEYLVLGSLVERAQLTALFLLRLAAGEIRWPTDKGIAK